MKRFITMKWVLAVITGALVALSVVAWRVQPLPAPSGKTPLVWVSDSNPLRNVQAELFNQTHPNDVLSIDPSNHDLEKVIVQSIGGVGPDIFDCFDGYQLTAYVRSGVALDVTDELKARGIDVLRDAYPGIQSTGVLDGRVYGVPTNVAADGVWIHKDLFDEAHLPYPKGPIHWDEFIAIAQKLTKKDKSGHVTRFGMLFPWWNWRHVMYGFGANVFTPDLTKCVVDQPKAVAAVQLMYDMVYKYHVSPSPSDAAGMAGQGGFGADDIGLFSSKRVAMAFGGRWWAAQLRKTPGLHLGVCESPYQAVREFRAYTRVAIINKETKHLAEALNFLAFLADRPYNELISDQADSIPAFRKYTTEQRFLHDPQHPEEDYNGVWLEITSHAVGDQVSPFIDGSVLNRLLQTQMDLVQNNIKSVPVALRDAASAVNAEIQKSIDEDPVLAERYRKLRALEGAAK